MLWRAACKGCGSAAALLCSLRTPALRLCVVRPGPLMRLRRCRAVPAPLLLCSLERAALSCFLCQVQR